MTNYLFILCGFIYLPWLSIWSLWLVLALMAAWARPQRHTSTNASLTQPYRIDVLIPAHNEEVLLPQLLASLRLQTDAASLQTILVVADHCSDQTAHVARQAGAVVLERHDGPKGKPAALRAGLQWLHAQTSLPDALLLLDADCTCSPNMLHEMHLALQRGEQALQAAYVLQTSPQAGVALLAEFGFWLKNYLHPLGLATMKLPTQMYGTGMLFHRHVLEHLTFEDHLIEDLRLSQTLLDQGIRPAFLPRAWVFSPMPTQRSAMTIQRLRWEGGQSKAWLTGLRLSAKLLLRGSFTAALSSLAWTVPPLTLTLISWTILTTLLILSVCLNLCPTTLLLWSALSALLLAAYLFLGLALFGKYERLLKMSLSIPGYLLWKLGIYLHMLLGRGPRAWEATPRTAVSDTPPSSGGGST